MHPLRIAGAAAVVAGAAYLLLQLGGSAQARNPAAVELRPPAPQQVFAPSAPLQAKLRAPVPQQVFARSAPLKKDQTSLVAFETAPFPYSGSVAETDKPFINVEENGRRGHRTAFGRTYWEDETYADSRVLLHIPKGFDVRRPSVMIVYFHGHGATLRRDVLARQRVPAQISASGVNAVLVVPQFAVDASDSSAGKFWQPGAFGEFLGEAAQKLALLHGDPRSVRAFASMPIVMVAYSGGYAPAAWCASRGGVSNRVRGVVLLDALYGELDKFASWISADRSAFFVSTYLSSTRDKNAELERVLVSRDVEITNGLDRRLTPGSVSIFAGVGDGTEGKRTHRDLVTHAWVDNPLADLLGRLKEYRR